MKLQPGTVYDGDCRLLLAGAAPEQVDAVITDMPYGTASPGKVQKRGSRLVAFDIDWDREMDLAWIPLAAAVLRPGGALLTFVDNKRVETVWTALEAVGLHPLHTVYWVKTNPPPQPRQNFCSGMETAVYAVKPGASRFWGGGGATPNWFAAPICGGDERTEHPTQKPLALMRWIVTLVAAPGAFVLDPFLGSGTTGEACILEERQWAGCELDPAMARVARERLRRVKAPLPGLAGEVPRAVDWHQAKLRLS